MSPEQKAVSPLKLKVLLPSQDGFIIEELDQILYCAANAMYSTLHFVNGSTLTLAKPLKVLEDIFPQGFFLRPHKSFLVNVMHIRGFNKNEVSLVLSDSTKIPVSARKAARIVAEIRNALAMN